MTWLLVVKRWLYIAGAVVVAVFVAWFQYLRKEVKEQKVKIDTVEDRNKRLRAEIDEVTKFTEVKQEIKDAEDTVTKLSDNAVDDQLLDKYTRNKD
jgi:Tfp pilus assembly protein PilN